MMVDSAGIVYKFVGKYNYKSNKYYEHDCGHVKPMMLLSYRTGNVVVPTPTPK